MTIEVQMQAADDTRQLEFRCVKCGEPLERERRLDGSIWVRVHTHLNALGVEELAAVTWWE
jgi:transcription initiation factor IIE alpha subunit